MAETRNAAPTIATAADSARRIVLLPPRTSLPK